MYSTWQNKRFYTYIIAFFPHIQLWFLFEGYIYIQDSFPILLLRWPQKAPVALSLTVV